MGLTLWTITEHIEPGGDRAEANQRYDDDLKRLIFNPASVTSLRSIALPPGGLLVAKLDGSCGDLQA